MTNYARVINTLPAEHVSQVDAVKAIEKSFGTTSFNVVGGIINAQMNKGLFENICFDTMRDYYTLLSYKEESGSPFINYRHLKTDHAEGKFVLSVEHKIGDQRVRLVASYEDTPLLDCAITMLTDNTEASVPVIDIEITRLYLDKAHPAYTYVRQAEVTMPSFMYYDVMEERKMFMKRTWMAATFNHEEFIMQGKELFEVVIEDDLIITQLLYNNYITVEELTNILWDADGNYNSDMESIEDAMRIKETLARFQPKPTPETSRVEETTPEVSVEVKDEETTGSTPRRFRFNSDMDYRLSKTNTTPEGSTNDTSSTTKA